MSISSGDPARLWARVGKSPSQLDAYSSDHYTLVKDRLLKILDQLAIKTKADLLRLSLRSIEYSGNQGFAGELSNIFKIEETTRDSVLTGITQAMLNRALQTGSTKEIRSKLDRLPSLTAEAQLTLARRGVPPNLLPDMSQTREAALGACKAIEDVIGARIINGQEISATPGIIPKARILQLHQPTVEDTNERRAA